MMVCMSMKSNKDYRDNKIVEYVDEGISRVYKVTATNEGTLNMLEKLFVYMQYLSVIGSSRSLTVYCDGDGAVNLDFKTLEEGSYIYQDLDYEAVMDKDSGYGNCRIEDDNSYFDLG